MKKIGKKLSESYKKLISLPKESLRDRINLVKECSICSFNSSIDLEVKTGIDSKKSDQNVRGSVVLPYSNGKKLKIGVFTSGISNIEEAKRNGAEAYDESAIADIKNGKIVLDIDKAIATPEMTSKLVPIAQILGKKGIMPSVKTNTVSADIKRKIEEIRNSAFLRNDKSGYIRFPVGRKNQSTEEILENIKSSLSYIKEIKPSAFKLISSYILRVKLSSTMGPSIDLPMKEVL